MPTGSNASNSFTREDSDFLSQGTRCAGWLYRPVGVSRPPVVVMAHGFAAERTFGLPAYAERFAERGMAVFLFDYRTFGDSDGEPRYLVSPRRHLKDWEAALSHVRALPDIDADKVAIWGSSYSGGHVTVIASRDPYVTAVVEQVPFVDGISSAYRTGIGHSIRCLPSIFKDLLTILFRRDPYYMSIVGKPGTLNIFDTPESYSGFLAIVPEDSGWRNECPARALLELLAYRPMAYAREVRCPALFMIGDRDSLIHPRISEIAASRMREVTLIHLDSGHFDVYVGDLFERVVKIQADFLARHLLET
jgi:dienelactone hydrolase